MKALGILRTCFIIAAGVLLGSCTPDGGTIYATIETEHKVVDNTLPNDLRVGDIVMAASGGPYYVAAGPIYKGTLSGGTITWTTLATTPAGSIANTLAWDGTNLWAGFFTPGTNLGLYRSSLPDTAAFVQEPAPAIGKQVTALQASGTDLFAAFCDSTATTYELDDQKTGTWTGPLAAVSGATTRIVGAANDGTANFFTASGLNVYAASSATGTYGVVKTIAAGEVTSIFGDAAHGRVFVTTRTEGIFYTGDSGGNWTQVAAPTVNSTVMPVLSIAGPIDAGNDKYLVGTDAAGFYTLSLGAGSLTRSTDSTIALYAASIRRILVDTNAGVSTVFMGTNGAGLWRASFDSTGSLSSTWTQE